MFLIRFLNFRQKQKYFLVNTQNLRELVLRNFITKINNLINSKNELENID
jgi:hypothetical protein